MKAAHIIHGAQPVKDEVKRLVDKAMAASIRPSLNPRGHALPPNQPAAISP